jgi:RNA ligase (TIGR02306 family)
MENLRKLASIRVINNICEIPNADAIELAIVDGWKVVVAKNVGHQIGNKVVYCEIDSFLPIEPEFEFLRKSSFKRMGDDEGFRLKSIRLRNTLSQGLIIPLSDAIEVMKRRNGEVYSEMLEVGTDVSELLGIQKYEPPIPAELAGKVRGNFPSFIRKTDEERVQNLKKEYEEYRTSGKAFYVAEKLDGSSSTFYIKNNVFGVCSRNLDLEETEENTFWKVARELDLETKMREFGGNFSLQGELLGEGVQGNPYKIKGQTVRFFNVFDIDEGDYLPLEKFKFIINHLGLETVPILDEDFTLPESVDELLNYADSKSVLNPQFDREGVVIRSTDRSISFKVISNTFLIKHEY